MSLPTSAHHYKIPPRSEFRNGEKFTYVAIYLFMKDNFMFDTHRSCYYFYMDDLVGNNPENVCRL